MINYQDFSYNGSKITFSVSQDVYVNATKMAKVFGKIPSKWLELPSTKDFLKALSDVRKSDITHLVITKKGNYSGGGEQGTWMHKDVAIEFARWLSPVFAIWCNDRILELLAKGHTEIPKQNGGTYVLPEPTPGITKDDSIVTGAQRSAKKDFSFSDVARMIIWGNRKMPKRMLVGWLLEHGIVRIHETGVPYSTEKALDQKLFLVEDKCNRGSCVRLKKPRVRISMDGANYIVKMLQHAMKGTENGKTGMINM